MRGFAGRVHEARRCRRRTPRRFPCDDGRRGARLPSACARRPASRGGRTRPNRRLSSPGAATAALSGRHEWRSRSPRRRGRSSPCALSRSRCGRRAFNSSSASRVRSSAEYQPDTQASPKGASAFFRASASRGNLLPSSMPTNPTSFASARQVSSGVSPPSSSMSSFDQPIGLAPIRIVIVVALSLVVSRPRAAAREHLRSACAPPSTSSRTDTSGTATSHQCPPASVAGSGSVSMTMTVVRSALRASLEPSSSSAMPSTLRRRAEACRMCAKSMPAGSRAWYAAGGC